MLGPYRYNLMIVHTFGSMLSIRNELPLQKDLPKFHINNVRCLDKK